MQTVKEGNISGREVYRKQEGEKRGRGRRKREGKREGNSGRFSADKWLQLQQNTANISIDTFLLSLS